MTKDELIDKLIAERDDLALQLDLMTDLKRAAGERAARVTSFLQTVTPAQFSAIPKGLSSWRERGFSKNQARALATLSALWWPSHK